MARDRIELSTPGFSDQCSTTELPRLISLILQYFPAFCVFFDEKVKTLLALVDEVVKIRSFAGTGLGL